MKKIIDRLVDCKDAIYLWDYTKLRAFGRILWVVILSFIAFGSVYNVLNKMYRTNADDTFDYIKCIDGDTAIFKINDIEVEIDFYGVDTPESVVPNEPIEFMGEEARKHTCSLLANAETFYLEHDFTVLMKDSKKYQKGKAWVFVDDKLLQESIVENGLGKVAYHDDNYEYSKILLEAQEKAQANFLGIWGD